MNIRNWIEDKIFSLKIGANVRTANDGKPIDVVTIRFKDFYFFIDIDVESQKPTGDFSWSHDPTMNPTVAIRDIWTAQPPLEQGKEKT